MGKGSDYTDKLRRSYETIDQSDSGMTRSDTTAARLRDITNRIKKAESAGAGRGGRGGPTAKELQNYEQEQDAGIWTPDKGAPPQEPDDASATTVRKAKGGAVTASSRADGIASRGKTRGKIC